MQTIRLYKDWYIPQTREELDKEAAPDRDERWLRNMLLNGFDPIYFGDTVRVSERYSGGNRNPHEGKRGVVADIGMGMQGAFNIDYLIYSIIPDRGSLFQTYLYTLDRLVQPVGNQMLVKLLRDTNAGYAKLYGQRSKKG